MLIGLASFKLNIINIPQKFNKYPAACLVNIFSLYYISQQLISWTLDSLIHSACKDLNVGVKGNSK